MYAETLTREHDMPGPEMILNRPPEAFGLTWIIKKNTGDGRVLYVAEAETEEFTEAWALIRTEVMHVGYSRTQGRAGDAWGGLSPSFWLRPDGWNASALRFYLDDALPSARKREAERLRRKAQDDAYWSEREAKRNALIAGARAAATASLGERRWAWVKAQNIAEAEALLAKADMDETGARRLANLTKAADANVARAAEAARIPDAAELAAAREPSIRVAAREAIVHITALDGDRAFEQNGVGWGRSTSIMGHVLAGTGDLDEAQASHALRILRLHRRQIPDPIAARLFGAVAA